MSDPKQKEPQFKKEDVWAVARTVGDGLYIDERGMNAHLICAHCSKSIYFSWQEDEGEQRKSFEHSTWCAVLIARDLLTGAPER